MSGTVPGLAVGPTRPPLSVQGSGREVREGPGPTLVGLDLIMSKLKTSMLGRVPCLHFKSVTSSVMLDQTLDDGDANTALPTPLAVLGKE